MAVDPDVGPRERHVDPAVLVAIAAGGVLGAEARYALELWLVSPAGTWPWATWLINVVGSFLIGVLMVVLTEVVSAHRLARPFLGVGVLGGYTTYSAFAVEVVELVDDGALALAAGYVLTSVVGGVAAVALGALAVGRMAR